MKLESKLLNKAGDRVTYRNRDGIDYTFELLEDGNVQWKGSFKYCRISYANDYSKAYKTYLKEAGFLTLPEFKDEIYRAVYDDQGTYLGMSELNKAYGKLVEPDTSIIEMVDPSGGPYLERCMELIRNRKIVNFKSSEEGFLIILE